MIEVPFGSLLKKIVDNRGKTCPITDSGIPLIATNCIKNDNLYPVYEKVRYVSDETYDNWFRGHPEPGDMIFVTKGTPGRVCWVKNPVDFCIAQDMVAIRADQKKIYPKYLFACLRSNAIQGEIENLHVGSLIPHFKKGDFNDLRIPVPDKQLQEKIGNFYFDISLKIDLLHRNNKTLEQLAETLFRQWFVEEAKDDWEECKIHTVAKINPESIGKDFQYSEIEYLDTGSITRGRVIGYQVLEISSAPSRAKRIVRANDIVYSLVRPIQRHYGLLINVKENTIVSTGFAVIRSNKFSPFFLYLLLTQDNVVEQLDSIAEGSTSAYPSLRPEDLGNIEFLLPPEEKLMAFDETVSGVWSKIQNNYEQIQRLEVLRDILLPKLMSGEVGF